MPTPIEIWERLAFVGNGCSAGPFSDTMNNLGRGLGRACCDTHDWHYHFADLPRHSADIGLWACISSLSGFWGLLAFVAVSIFGWLFYEYARRKSPPPPTFPRSPGGVKSEGLFQPGRNRPPQ